MNLLDTSLYEIMGDEGFRRLVSGFYRRVPGDPILGPMYPAEDFEGAAERLRLFLIQRFGGPTTYSDQRGHPRLRMRHAPFPVDVHARNRWVELMDAALVEAQLPPPVMEVLRRFFADTATFMMNR